jgi:hypothetical protein
VYLFPQQFTAAFQNLCANLVAHLHMRF